MIIENPTTRYTWSAIKYIFAIFVAIIILAPFVWLIISSVEPSKVLIHVPFKLSFSQMTFSRYGAILHNTNPNSSAYVFRHAMLNSIIVAVSVMLISIFIGLFAAYAIARLRFPLRNSIMFFFLFTFMVPPISIVMPVYVIFSHVHLLDSKLTLIIVYCSFVLPYTIWVLQGYLIGFPYELEEAARVDGCNRFTSMVKVILPIAFPGIIATAVFALLLAWDQFLYALILTSSVSSTTIPVAIASFVGKNTSNFGMIAAGGVLAALPPTIFALIFQRFIVGGLTSGSVKG